MATVYRHLRNDTNEPFYVGIGKTNKRAYSKSGRTMYWNRIVQKHGYTVDIIYEHISWDEACKIEQYLISFYGRADLGLGPLINMTNGGEGVNGWKHTPKSLNRMKQSKKGLTAWNKGKKQSEETIAKRVAKTSGKKRSAETKMKMSLSAFKRSQNPEYIQKLKDSRQNYLERNKICAKIVHP